jgi:hypothetical protein
MKKSAGQELLEKRLAGIQLCDYRNEDTFELDDSNVEIIADSIISDIKDGELDALLIELGWKKDEAND